jgi:hypothetical protein
MIISMQMGGMYLKSFLFFMTNLLSEQEYGIIKEEKIQLINRTIL